MAGLLIPASPIVARDAVSAELRLWAQTRFAWGTSDCLLSVVRYVERVTGRIAPPWPRYSTGPGAARILQRHGGLEAYTAGIMTAMGCDRTAWPRRGDVGLIDVPVSGFSACLCLGDKWAVRAADGIVIAEMVPEAAWAVVPKASCNRGDAPCQWQ